MQKARFSIFWDLGSPVQIFAKKTNGNQKKEEVWLLGFDGKAFDGQLGKWESSGALLPVDIRLWPVFSQVFRGLKWKKKNQS